MLTTKQNVSIHLFNMIAVENRIPLPSELSGIPANPPLTTADIDLMKYVPNREDEKLILSDFKVLVTRDLLKNVDELAWMRPLLPQVIEHKYMHYTKQKSNVVSIIGN